MHDSEDATLPHYLSAEALDALIAHALKEDVGPGDVTTQATIGPDVQTEARLQAKEQGVIAGLAVAGRVFHAVDADVQVAWATADGEGGVCRNIQRICRLYEEPPLPQQRWYGRSRRHPLH